MAAVDKRRIVNQTNVKEVRQNFARLYRLKEGAWGRLTRSARVIFTANAEQSTKLRDNLQFASWGQANPEW